eukprot:CAMPEP_0116096532 /NCGR_PEP_ID=MMETSP0327-20121206/10228_1 /TAXON_ID=44447 /ORGANISM="Pseudo-nitzschia delicatissima, Strain B596" /LENGTH=88 /DNA_ID=CAMNT_0003588235 /DNA_START=1230 /DNA_END=1496 /DNA_ORIENTATION=-
MSFVIEAAVDVNADADVNADVNADADADADVDDIHSDDILAVDFDETVDSTLTVNADDTTVLVTNPSENCPGIKTASTNASQCEYIVL